MSCSRRDSNRNSSVFKPETHAVTYKPNNTTSVNSVWSHLDMNSWAPTGDTPITAHLVNFLPLRDSLHEGSRRSVCWYVCLLAADYILTCIDVRLGLLTIGTTQGERYARDVV
jgi:hypothetical protein